MAGVTTTFVSFGRIRPAFRSSSSSRLAILRSRSAAALMAAYSNHINEDKVATAAHLVVGVQRVHEQRGGVSFAFLCDFAVAGNLQRLQFLLDPPADNERSTLTASFEACSLVF